MLAPIMGLTSSRRAGDLAADHTLDSALAMALLSTVLDRITTADLERERLLLGHSALDDVLTERICAGLQMIADGQALAFDWRPIHSSSTLIEVSIPESVAEELCLAAEGIGFAIEILVSAFATSELCKPQELVELDLSAVLRSRPHRSGRILRTEPGRGNIYDASFEMPGYQLAFLGLLSGREVSQSDVLDEALLALASQVCSTNSIAGRPLSPDAYSMASRMLTMAGVKVRYSARPQRRERSSARARSKATME